MSEGESFEIAENRSAEANRALVSSIADLVEAMNQNVGNNRGALRSAMDSCSDLERNSLSAAEASQTVRTSIADISKQAKSASETIGQIEHNVGRAQENSGGLERSVERIASVVVLINKIARQTHLLSLNATIEAARVGDAGRGFSVVANEVKELANQTSLATEEITSHVKQIQSSSRETIESVKLISADIHGMAMRMASIAEAVGHQEYSVAETVTALETCTEALGALRTALGNIQKGAAVNFERTNAMSDLLRKLHL